MDTWGHYWNHEEMPACLEMVWFIPSSLQSFYTWGSIYNRREFKARESFVTYISQESVSRNIVPKCWPSSRKNLCLRDLGVSPFVHTWKMKNEMVIYIHSNWFFEALYVYNHVTYAQMKIFAFMIQYLKA